MAAALFSDQVARLNQNSQWAIGSAGTLAQDGVAATAMAQLVMAEKNINLRTHRSRVVTATLLEAATVVLTMTQNHREALCAEFPQYAPKIRLFSQLIDQEFDIHDPVLGGADDYRACANELQAILEKGFDQLIKWSG